jgi:hypothetical protein
LWGSNALWGSSAVSAESSIAILIDGDTDR